MGRFHFPENWIGDLFDKFELRCPEGTCWRIGGKISERSILVPAYGRPKGKAEALAVYHCEEIIGGKPNGRKAIVEVRMQVPPEPLSSFDPKVRARYAEKVPAGWTLQEIYTLQYFNKKKCTVVPELLSVVSFWQTPTMPVPEGYLEFIVMEKLPGVPLVGFWGYSRPKGDKNRESFRKSMT
ncbi:hypothetical protein AJ79_07359 [Helicocarpus griseus UAMH5409]|uniref:Uncharacterized protein n=1 Tax=Helicocarpus griseus UAMH5409 TaxID=1447875 RepID=A0A2B7WVW9_9EURO|nr:hypothetical protein AJ79_07359 [Helicocarpus griseus UAMH5409]